MFRATHRPSSEA